MSMYPPEPASTMKTTRKLDKIKYDVLPINCRILISAVARRLLMIKSPPGVCPTVLRNLTFKIKMFINWETYSLTCQNSFAKGV